MSEPKNNMPVIIGVVALLAIAGGAMFYFSSNMKKEAPAIAEQAPATETASGTSAAEAPSNISAEPPVTVEETEEVNKAAAQIDGIEVEKGNPVVAKVDGKDITRVDVFRYIKMMPENVRQLPPQAVYPLALDQVVNTRLVQNKAENAGLENDPEVQQQLSMARQQIIRSVYVQRAVDKEISEADMKAKYAATIGKSPAIEEVKAAHILVEDEAKAKALIAKLDAGEDFAKLAAANSADPGNKDKGGDLGWFAKTDMVPEFADAAFEIGKGKVGTKPVQTQFGWHVIKVEDKRERPKPTFEEVKPMIQVELRREKLESMLENWKEAAAIEKFDINGKPVQEVAPAAGDTSAPATTPAPDAAAAPATAE